MSKKRKAKTPAGPKTRLESNEAVEIKALNSKLEAALGELKDTLNYDAKYLDAEPSGSNNNFSADFSGIDQHLDAAVLQSLYATETWVYTAVTEIAKTISSLPLKLERRVAVKKTVKNPVTGADEIINQIVWDDATGEDLFKCFERPNAFTTKAEWLMLLAIDLLTTGEYYIYLDSDEDLTALAPANPDEPVTDPFARLQRTLATTGTIKGMYRIPPTLIKPVPDQKAGRGFIAGYAMESDNGVFAFNFAEIIHVKLPNPSDPYRGLSPLVAAFKPVLLDRFSTEHMVRFYKTGARLGGVIETDKNLNKEQLSRFQRTFESNFTGRKNHHRTLILPPGMKYTTIEQNPGETALLDFCKYNREAILSVYHVPPIKVGILDNANYANARVQLQIFFVDTVKPLLRLIEDGYNHKASLMPQNGGYRIKFDLSDVEVLKEDFLAMATMASAMIKAGLTINEVRKLVWREDPIAKGDKQFNVAEIEKLEASGASGPVFGLAAPAPTDLKDGAAAPLTTEGQPSLIHTDVAGPGPKKPEESKCNCSTKCDCGPGCSCGPSCECCKPPGGKTLSDKEKLSEFIKDSLSKLGPDEEISPEFIAELVTLFNEQRGIGLAAKETAPDTAALPEADSAPTQEEILDTTPKSYPNGYTKDQIVEHWKNFATKADPLIAKRKGAVVKFFKAAERTVLNRFGANIKSFGIMKSRDSDDISEILDTHGFSDVIKEYVKEIDVALKEAYKTGYTETLTEFVFNPPSEVAAEWLKRYGAEEVKHILDTTREQLKEVLTEAFEEGVSVTEVASRIKDKFGEMEEGRAETIARTETLSAVSAGQEQKSQDWQKEFPEKRLMKMWVSAQDDRVRDSHQELDGEVVELSADFSNGLQYPREVGGDPSEVINCRCARITYAEEDSESIDSTLPPKDDAEEE